MAGRGWRDPLAPSALAAGMGVPLSAEDGYPWALQSWDRRAGNWRWSSLGLVPLKREPADLRRHARRLELRVACRYVWIRHWTPERRGDSRGWLACIDTRKTVGPVRP
jgi:hypothetical protein